MQYMKILKIEQLIKFHRLRRRMLSVNPAVITRHEQVDYRLSATAMDR